LENNKRETKLMPRNCTTETETAPTLTETQENQSAVDENVSFILFLSLKLSFFQIKTNSINAHHVIYGQNIVI